MKVISIQGNTIDRSAKMNGCGWCEDTMYSLTSIDRHGVAYCMDARNGVLIPELSHTVQAKASGGISLNCTPNVIYPNSKSKESERADERRSDLP